MSTFKCQFDKALAFFSGPIWEDMYGSMVNELNALTSDLVKQDVSERESDFVRGKIAQILEFMDLKDMMLAAIAVEQGVDFDVDDGKNEDNEEEPQDE